MGVLLGRQAISPLLPEMIQDLAISPSQAGFALTLMMGIYSISQYPGGQASDQLSRTTVLVLGLSITIGGFTILSGVSTYGILLLGVALIGIGSGVFFSPSRAFLSDIFVERRGQIFGLHTAAGQMGGMLAAGSAAIVLSFAVWRVVFVLPAVLLVSVVFLLHRWSRENYVFSRVSFQVRGTSSRIFKSTRTRWLIVGYVFFGFTIQAYLGFLPTLLQVEKEFTPLYASVGYALVYAIGVVSAATAGRISDWMPRPKVVIGALLIAAIGLGLILIPQSRLIVIFGIGVASVGIWAFVPSMQSYLMDIVSNDNLGSDFGMMKGIYTGLGSLGPTYVGVVAEATNYIIAFYGLIGCLLLSTILIHMSTRTN
jgi:MFS family permease